MTIRALFYGAVLALSALCPAVAGPQQDVVLAVDEQRLRETIAADGAELLAFSPVPKRFSLKVLGGGESLRAEGRFWLEARVRLAADSSDTRSQQDSRQCSHSKPSLNMELGVECEPQASIVVMPPPTVWFSLRDVRLVEGDERAFDVLWECAAISQDKDGGWQGFRSQGRRAQIQLNGPGFESAIQKAFREFRLSMEDLPLTPSDTILPPSPHGISDSLRPPPTKEILGGGAEATREWHVEQAKAYLAGGNLVLAEGHLGQVRGQETLRRVLLIKQWILGQALRTTDYYLFAQEPEKAHTFLVESFGAEGWSHSSALQVDRARVLLQLGRPQEALQLLEEAMRNNPTLATDPLFKDLWAEAS